MEMKGGWGGWRTVLGLHCWRFSLSLKAVEVVRVLLRCLAR